MLMYTGSVSVRVSLTMRLFSEPLRRHFLVARFSSSAFVRRSAGEPAQPVCLFTLHSLRVPDATARIRTRASGGKYRSGVTSAVVRACATLDKHVPATQASWLQDMLQRHAIAYR